MRTPDRGQLAGVIDREEVLDLKGLLSEEWGRGWGFPSESDPLLCGRKLTCYFSLQATEAKQRHTTNGSLITLGRLSSNCSGPLEQCPKRSWASRA